MGAKEKGRAALGANNGKEGNLGVTVIRIIEELIIRETVQEVDQILLLCIR